MKSFKVKKIYDYEKNPLLEIPKKIIDMYYVFESHIFENEENIYKMYFNVRENKEAYILHYRSGKLKTITLCVKK